MSRSILFLATLLAVVGCKKHETESPLVNPKTAEPAPAINVALNPPQPLTPPVYTKQEALKQIAKLSTCAGVANCEPYNTLVGFGPAASMDVLDFAVDPNAPFPQRRIAARAIGVTRVGDNGLKLIDAASKMPETESLTMGAFYEAAGMVGGTPILEALLREYTRAIAVPGAPRATPLRQGLRAFPTEATAWAITELPKQKNYQVHLADLIVELATPADRGSILGVITRTTDPMAKHRLAMKAIALGAVDPSLFDVFVTDLSSNNRDIVADAGVFLSTVASQVPVAYRAKLVPLLQKQLKDSKDPARDLGLQKSLDELQK